MESFQDAIAEEMEEIKAKAAVKFLKSAVSKRTTIKELYQILNSDKELKKTAEGITMGELFGEAKAAKPQGRKGSFDLSDAEATVLRILGEAEEGSLNVVALNNELVNEGFELSSAQRSKVYDSLIEAGKVEADGEKRGKTIRLV